MSPRKGSACGALGARHHQSLRPRATSRLECVHVCAACRVGGRQGEVRAEFMAELFDPGTIERLVRSLGTVLQHAVTQPSTPYSALPVLSAAAAAELLGPGFGTGPVRPDYMAGPLVHEAFEAAAAAEPSAPCLIYEDQALSYGEVEARANALAHR